MTNRRSTGFTLIELMVVVAIMGLLLTMSVPIVYKVWHKAPMHQAVVDIEETLRNARAKAIMQGTMTELVFHPRARELGKPLPDGINIDLLDINMSGQEFRDVEEARVRFYPNGTADELKMVLSSGSEQLGIEVELTTGLASVVSDPMRSWARR
jgi:type II secretion system protein H